MRIERTERVAGAAFLLLGFLALAGCDSAANPANWFDGSEPPATLEPEGGYAAATLDPRPLIQEVSDLVIERTDGGVIVRATGLPPTGGYWGAALIPQTGDAAGGTMTYNFVAVPPAAPRASGSPWAREITAAAFIPNTKLAGISQIVVQGQTNQRSSRR